MSRWLVIEQLGEQWDAWVDSCPNSDVYHSSGYLAAMMASPEMRPRLLVYESELGTVVHPLLLRPLDDSFSGFPGLCDATSCYGYGGPAWRLRRGAARTGLLSGFWAEEGSILRELGVVSEFVRLHPLIPSSGPLRGSADLVERGRTVAVDLSRDASALTDGLATIHRGNIERARKCGVEVRVSDRPDLLDEFCLLYRQTMDRLGARPEYYFPRSTLSGLFALPGGSAWLATAHLQGQVVAASIFLSGRRFWHYHLAASNEVARRSGANHLLLFESMLFAKALGRRQAHLGGGLGGGDDGLLRFKVGFGGRLHPFRTVQRVVLPATYDELCGYARVDAGGTAFFPAYRDPAPTRAELWGAERQAAQAAVGPS